MNPMKTIYFVRHGETEFNIKRIHQHPDVPLSELGLKQAEFVAMRFLHIPIDCIVASPYLRARQTTEAIILKTQKPVKYNSFFIELKNPSEIEGKQMDEPELRLSVINCMIMLMILIGTIQMKKILWTVKHVPGKPWNICKVCPKTQF